LSVQNELIALKEARDDLKKQLAEICSTLNNLYAKRAPLVQKAENLSTRTSSLEQTLLEKVQEELGNINQDIAQAKKRQAEIKKELETNQQNILLKEDRVSLYINAQSSTMVSTFFEYVRNHLEEFGGKIKKTFRIIEITHYEDDTYGGCYVPTGNFGIYDESNKSFIVSSKAFYFKKILCTFTRGEYEQPKCWRTEWYKAYRNLFVSHLLETLKKDYTCEKFFKLTIEDSCFTLELV